MNTETELPANFTVAENQNQNLDPLTQEPGAHPVSTGVGAAGGGATGAAIGVAVGGPIGGIIGAVIGAVTGGLGGKKVGESIEPTATALPAQSWPEQQAEIRDDGATGDSLPVALHEHGADLISTEAAPIAPTDGPAHEEIALRAWSLYQESGFRAGCDYQNWIQAERQLRAERGLPLG